MFHKEFKRVQKEFIKSSKEFKRLQKEFMKSSNVKIIKYYHRIAYKKATHIFGSVQVSEQMEMVLKYEQPSHFMVYEIILKSHQSFVTTAIYLLC